jgi:hypothetical protein
MKTLKRYLRDKITCPNCLRRVETRRRFLLLLKFSPSQQILAKLAKTAQSTFLTAMMTWKLLVQRIKSVRRDLLRPNLQTKSLRMLHPRTKGPGLILLNDYVKLRVN